MNRVLVIQTSFIGDAILATSLLESIHAEHKHAKIDLLVRKGNEGIFENHPFLHDLLIWDKSNAKIANLIKLVLNVRRSNYDTIINAHRFSSSGLITALSGAKDKSGFKKNPLSIFYSNAVDHSFDGQHEIERNHALLDKLVETKTPLKPRVYPSQEDFHAISQYQESTYICIAPTSVWHTKQWPMKKWVELCNKIPTSHNIYLLGAKADESACREIMALANRKNIFVLAGKLSLLQSAALMDKAEMNYVNDSAPMHLASSMNAKTTAIYCSTIPKFGFGPLSQDSKIVETSEDLSCRPCGLHGHMDCPKGHFKCSEINVETILL